MKRILTVTHTQYAEMLVAEKGAHTPLDKQEAIMPILQRIIAEKGEEPLPDPMSLTEAERFVVEFVVVPG